MALLDNYNMSLAGNLSGFYRQPLNRAEQRQNLDLEERRKQLLQNVLSQSYRPEAQKQAILQQQGITAEPTQPVAQPQPQLQPWQIYAGQMAQQQPMAGGVLSGTMPMVQTTPQARPQVGMIETHLSQLQTPLAQAKTQAYQQPAYSNFSAPQILSRGIW